MKQLARMAGVAAAASPAAAACTNSTDTTTTPAAGAADAAAATRQQQQLVRWLKPLARKGIPPGLRPSMWALLSGGAARQAAAGPGAYAALVGCARTTLPRDAHLSLREDLSAGCFAFRTHPAFRAAAGGMPALQPDAACCSRPPAPSVARTTSPQAATSRAWATWPASC
jgi:hypothetical protein